MHDAGTNPKVVRSRDRFINEVIRGAFRLTKHGGIAVGEAGATVCFVRVLILNSGRGMPAPFGPRLPPREDLNMAKLCLLGRDGATGQQCEIRDQPVTVGRGASVDVKVEDDGLSRRHFMIAREGDEFVIKDLSSRNGTWVHGHRALTAKLHHNDCILAGQTLFRFCEEQDALAPARPGASSPHGTEILPATL